MSKTYKRYQPEDDFSQLYPLDAATMRRIPEDLYGVYVLVAPADDKGGVLAVYVGRGVIKQRMSEHIEEKEASHFAFKSLDDEDEAFAEECRLFHKYGKRQKLDNVNHPAVPAGSPKSAPRCSMRGCNGEAD